eukprot:3542265-Alexandrium_andersonii.AAC.1
MPRHSARAATPRHALRTKAWSDAQAVWAERLGRCKPVRINDAVNVCKTSGKGTLTQQRART